MPSSTLANCSLTLQKDRQLIVTGNKKLFLKNKLGEICNVGFPKPDTDLI